MLRSEVKRSGRQIPNGAIALFVFHIDMYQSTHHQFSTMLEMWWIFFDIKTEERDHTAWKSNG